MATFTEHSHTTAIYPSNIERYRNVVAHAMSEIHGCPPATVDALLSDYEDVLLACWTGGIAACTPIKLLFAEWKTFRTEAHISDKELTV